MFGSVSRKRGSTSKTRSSKRVGYSEQTRSRSVWLGTDSSVSPLAKFPKWSRKERDCAVRADCTNPLDRGAPRLRDHEILVSHDAQAPAHGLEQLAGP